jgi:hypothetical protein
MSNIYMYLCIMYVCICIGVDIYIYIYICIYIIHLIDICVLNTRYTCPQYYFIFLLILYIYT